MAYITFPGGGGSSPWTYDASFNLVSTDAGGSIGTGAYNFFAGFGAGAQTTDGSTNVAIGQQALHSNTLGGDNNAIGFYAMYSNTEGNTNNAIGVYALSSNTLGLDNAAFGSSALSTNSTGNRNTGIGKDAGSALTTGDDNVCIANVGVAGETGIIRIGTAGTHTATYIAGDIYANGNISAGTITGSVLVGPQSTQITTQTVTADTIYPVLSSDSTILADPDATHTLTCALPTAVGIAGRIYTFKLIASATLGTLVIDGNGTETIDGATTKTLSVLNAFVTIQSDGANWQIIG